MAVDQSLPSQIAALLLRWPGHVDSVHLEGGGAAKTVTVPPNAIAVIFSPYPKSADFLTNKMATATRPTADVVNGTASWPNPTGLRDLSAGETFSMIAGDTTVDVALFWTKAPRNP
jgi:hypothetical protein